MSIKKFTFGLAVVALALGVAVSAGAQTTDLQTLLADIARLEAQIRMLTGGAPTGGVPMSGATSFTRDLTIGSSGADVTALQTILENGGYLVMPVGVPKGYFGNLTKMALAAWQTANGVTPAYGYFGPVSRAKYNAVCTPAEEEEEAAEEEEIEVKKVIAETIWHEFAHHFGMNENEVRLRERKRETE